MNIDTIDTIDTVRTVHQQRRKAHVRTRDKTRA